MKNVFDEIYRMSLWSDAGHGSGIGSEPAYNARMRRALTEFVADRSIRSIVDAPCGAAKWQAAWIHELNKKRVAIESYFGIDVAPTAVRRARSNLEHLSIARVRGGDARIAKLPPCDLLICRDTLQHLSYSNIWKVLINLARCDARWIAIGGYWPGNNVDVRDGSYFDFNACLPPFELRPNEIISEANDPKHPAKHLFIRRQVSRKFSVMKT